MKHSDSGRARVRGFVLLSSGPIRAAIASALLPAFVWWSGPIQANPRGGVVVHGDVAMQDAGGLLTVRQGSANAIIDWEHFSIDAGEMTRFIQPGKNAAVLNRVTGGDLSEIHGSLRANGNVFLINPSGIVVGPGGSIDVHGLVLSTLDLENGEFLAGGDMVFKGSSAAGITNLGRIQAIGGDVFLIGRTVTNSGSIHAREGTVGLAAGEEVLIKAEDGFGGERVYIRATGSGVSDGRILNDGTIAGAAAELKAHGNHYALAINNKGAIRATGVVNVGGRVHLQGIGGGVSNSGSIRATSSGVGRGASILIAAAYAKVDGELRAEGHSAAATSVTIASTEKAEIGGTIEAVGADGSGGNVRIEGGTIGLAAGAVIDVSGDGGGEVRIGGGFQGGDPGFPNARRVEVAEGAAIRADAIGSGNAGRIILWADEDTIFKGEISARGIGSGAGGFVEVSGKEGLLVDGTVSTLAASGAHGQLLLDPKNITISTAASSATNINNTTLATLVGTNHVIVSTLDAGTAQAGHISVSAPVRYNSSNSLTLLAEGDLYIGDDILNQGAGNVNLVAGWNPAVMPLATLLGGATATPHATLPGTSTLSADINFDATVFATEGAFGNAGGSVYVGSLGAPNVAADRAIAVGSRVGQTNVAGYDVNVWGAALTGGINAGAQRYSQIGYNRRDANTAVTLPATGRIRVGAVNDVSVVANKYAVGIQGSSGWTATTDNTGNASFAQIGHGGERDSARDMEMSGQILVKAGGNLSLLGGKAFNNHATIGHGAYDNRDTDFVRLASIGAAPIDVEVGGNVDLIAGLGYHAHVQIGHGGGNLILSNFTESAIQVKAGGDVTVRGGAGVASVENNTRSQAQIGHGGFDADLFVGSVTATPGSGKGYKGDITVTADGAVKVISGNFDTQNIAVIGNGGMSADGDHSGNITVTAGTGVEVTGGTGASTLFAQIGHIAYDSANLISGDVLVTANDGGVRLTGSGNTATSANYANIGSGGYLIKTGSTVGGDTTVISRGTDVTDGIVLRSGDGTYASAQIGHVSQLGAAGPVMTLTGDVAVEVSAGGLMMEASSQGYFSHVMIGHGGRDLSGTKSGNVRVEVASGDLSLLAGGTNATSRYNHAQIGHGGYGNGISGSDLTGTGTAQGIQVAVEGGNILIQAGRNASSYAMVGNGGVRAGAVGTFTQTGDIALRASGDITLNGGTASYAFAQIGHGGPSSIANYVWNLGGAIEVKAGGNVSATGGTASVTNVQIGHGGIATTTTSSIAASPISVTATTGDVLLLSGTASSSGAKIGHGNYNLKLATFGESPVTVSAGRHVRLVSPQFGTYTAVSNSGTQIGHGGFGATVGPLPSTLGYSGDISVTAGGKLDVLAGTNAGSYNWSLLGHTSYYNSTGIHTGDISVTTGTRAGLSDYGVTVYGASGDYLPLAATNSTTGGYYSFASIGHRGHSNATATYYTGLHGDILVDVLRGGVSVLGGDGVDGSTTADTPPDIRLHGAQIGHGGYAAGHPTEGITGSVRVLAEGDILMRSGTSRNAAVMIGHGGYASFGPMGKAGDVIEVISRSGGLELDSTLAINTTRGGVMIGHGAPTPGAGTRMGDILVDVAGEISFVGNLSSIGHRTTTTGGITGADLTIRGRSFDRTTGDSGSGLFRVDSALGTMLTASLAGGDVSLVGMGSTGVEMNAPMVWTSGFDFNLLAYHDIHIVDDLLNRGAGDVNVFAGWDPAAAPLGAGTIDGSRGDWIRDLDADLSLFGVAGAYGGGNGSVWIGAYADLSAADRSVAVGSRTGQTNVAGHEVKVWGASFTGGINAGQQRYSQIGYNRRDAGTTINDVVSGRIRVAAVNDIEVIANQYQIGVQGSNGWLTTTDNRGNASYAQIGHGGDRDSVRDMRLSGGILVEAGGNLSLLGGIAYNNHASIGHGGYDNPDDDDDTNLATLGGDIAVKVGGDVTLQAGLGYHAHVQIGHGGGNHYLADFTESALLVDAGGDVIVKGGAGVAGVENNSRSQAQIGHGGYNADFIADSTPGIPDNVIPVVAGSGRGYKGDITVSAGGSVRVESGHHDTQNLAFIGNGGLLTDGDHSGTITVTSGSGVDVIAGTGAESLLAQIGHMAYSSANAISGDVVVTARDGGVRLSGGGSTAAYAAIGNGGFAPAQGSSISGATRVFSEGSDTLDGIVMRSGIGNYASAHIGHLSQRSAGGTVHPVATLSGEVEVSIAGGGLTMEAADGTYAHVMIGHGGRDSSGDKSGKVMVTVDTGDLMMKGGTANAGDRYNHAQIGHGGYGNGVSGSYTGDIEVEATTGAIDLLAGESGFSYARIGHGGSGAGDSSVLTLGGAIAVKAAEDLTLAGGTRGNADAQIGHGGRLYTVDAPVGRSAITASPVTVEAGGDILLLSGSVSYTPAKIGHGGTQLKLSSFGESSIDVKAGGDLRLVSPQFETYTSVAYSNASIGHGGVFATVGDGLSGYSGDVSVEAGGKIDVLASKNSGTYNWSLIGHTSYYSSNSRGIHLGDVSVKSGTVAGLGEYGLTIRAASGDFSSLPALSATGSYYSFAAIGHRGHSANTSLSGDVSVEVVRGGITIQGGNGIAGTTAADTPPDIRLHGAQIGHGGYNISGAGLSGSVRVAAQSDILLRAGTARHSAVLIGHGGYLSSGAMGLAGDVIEVISREGSLELDSSLAPTNPVDGGGVYIGHGAPALTAGVRQGDILVDVAGEISLVGALPTWIGHRTSTSGGIANADVTIRARSLDTVSGDSGGGLFRLDPFLGSVLQPHLAAGHLSLVATGGEGLEIQSRLVGNSAFDLNLLSHSDVYILDDVLNQGSGDVNVIAGWDPSIAPLYSSGDLLPTNAAAPLYREYWIRDVVADAGWFATSGAYGKGEGSVWIGAGADLAAADRSVAVGSRAGQTNVAAHDVEVWGSALTGGVDSGSGKYSQIGYNRADGGTAANAAATGRIRVEALGDISLDANHFAVGTAATGMTFAGVDQTGFASFAKIGHGGERDTTSGSVYSGDILISAGGDLFGKAGGTLESFVQIGHGGHIAGAGGSVASGAIRVAVGDAIDLAGGAGMRASVRIGHGGDLSGGTRSGSIFVDAGGAISLKGGAGGDAGAQIGHGGVGAGGSSSGTIEVTTTGDLLLEGGSDTGSSAQIGHGGRQASGTVVGTIAVSAHDLSLLGGSGLATGGQIGHGGYIFGGSVDDQDLSIEATGDLVLTGGSGKNASVQVGHGGYASGGILTSGDLAVEVLGEIGITGGSGLFAHAQIGNLGGSTNARMRGDIAVTSGGDITLAATATSVGAYTKIGHGHDFLPPLAGVVEVAEITGDLRVATFANLSLTDAMIGHLNAASSAVASGGITQIAVGTGAPADPLAGTLTANAASEFSGADELRFYLAQRGNNRIAAGALLNGHSYSGAAPDPYDHQRDDEYAIHLLGDLPGSPAEHASIFDSGPAPANAAGFAFYYDTITIVAGAGLSPVIPPPANGGPGGNGGGGGPGTPVVPVDPADPFGDMMRGMGDDDILENWLRDHEKVFSRMGDFRILYENFDQYQTGGESTPDLDWFPSEP